MRSIFRCIALSVAFEGPLFEAPFLATVLGAFLAFAATFLAAGFLTTLFLVDFAATFLAAGFLTTLFLVDFAATFLAAGFLTTLFLVDFAATFLAADFLTTLLVDLVAVFFAAAFFCSGFLLCLCQGTSPLICLCHLSARCETISQ